MSARRYRVGQVVFVLDTRLNCWRRGAVRAVGPTRVTVDVGLNVVFSCEIDAAELRPACIACPRPDGRAMLPITSTKGGAA